MAYIPYPQQSQPQAQQQPKSKPFLKIYVKDANGKKVAESEIAFWKNLSKNGQKEYLSGKDTKGVKYVGFFAK